MIRGDRILVQPRDLEPRLYRYSLGANAAAERIEDAHSTAPLLRQLQAYLQIATASLLANTAGDREREETATGKTLARVAADGEPPIAPKGQRGPREG